MTMTRTELQNAMSLEAVAKRLEQAGNIKLNCDFDAVPYGEEKFATAHFGRLSDLGKDMVSVWTDSRDESWTVRLTVWDQLHVSEFVFSEFSFKDAQLMNALQVGGRDRPARKLNDDVPEVFLQLVAAAKERGLADLEFHFSNDDAPRPGR